MTNGEVQKQIVANGIRIILPGALLLIVVVGVIVFWPQFSALFQAKSDIERGVRQSTDAVERVNTLEIWKRDADNKIEILEGNQDRISSRVEGIFNKEETFQDEVEAMLSLFEKRIVVVEDDVGDMEGAVSRLEKYVRANTEWRDDQEKRAARRVTQQEFRDVSIAQLKDQLEHLKNETIVIERRLTLLEAGYIAERGGP